MRSTGLDWDGTCLHITVGVSSWMMATLFPTDVFQLVNGRCIHVSTMEESVHGMTHQLCCWVPLEGLALPPIAIRVLAVELVSLKTGWCGRSNMFASPWEFTTSLWFSPFYFHTKLWYWTLSSGWHSRLSAVTWFLRSAERREDPSCLGSNFVGSLKTNLPSCWVVCVLKCCSQVCCSYVMVNCSTDSTSQKRLKLCSRLLFCRSRNVCWGSVCVAGAGVRQESVQPRTVSCRTG